MPNNLTAAPVFDLPSSRQGEALVRAIESAASVRRRSQFFVWSQGQLQALVPHQLAVCGAYQRMRKELVFDAFYSVPIASSLLEIFADSGSALMRRLIATWVEGEGRCAIVDVRLACARGGDSWCAPLLDAGFEQLLVHGVARPQRPAELESLFVLSSAGAVWNEQHRLYFDLLLPHVHSTYQRVQVNEREFGPALTAPATRHQAPGSSPITVRERQILAWVREGMSNHQIGTQLDISALTVKNHVQKILRKLGAANRAQAVALAIGRNLLGTPDGRPND